MTSRQHPEQRRRREKNKRLKVGDLVKINETVPLIDEDLEGAVGMIVSFNESGYPKGLTGHARGGTMYTVAALGRNIKLFEDEIEVIA